MRLPIVVVLILVGLTACSQWQAVPEQESPGRTESPLTLGLLDQIDSAIELSDLASADRLVRRGLQIDPFSPALMTRLAQIRWLQERPQQSLQAIQKARSLNPSAADQKTLDWLASQMTAGE